MLTLNECVEKQIEKAPRISADDLIIIYKCPRCWAPLVGRIGNKWLGGGKHRKYCADCGQKIKWTGIV